MGQESSSGLERLVWAPDERSQEQGAGQGSSSGWVRLVWSPTGPGRAESRGQCVFNNIVNNKNIKTQTKIH